VLGLEWAEAALEHAFDAVITIDAAGVVAEWNAVAERLFGFSHDEAVGRPLVGLIVPDDLRAAHTAALERAARGGGSPIIDRRIELRGRHRGGREIPVELMYRALGPPDGPAVYRHCVPGDGSLPHLLTWSEARSERKHTTIDLRIDSPVAAARALSPSELRVLRAAANGLPAIEPARDLGIGTETVKTQRRQVILKLGSCNITQAVAIATAQGILAIDRTPRSLAA
jgi:PAS domain S-box-containing protein